MTLIEAIKKSNCSMAERASTHAPKACIVAKEFPAPRGVRIIWSYTDQRIRMRPIDSDFTRTDWFAVERD